MRKLLIRTEVYLKTDEFSPKDGVLDDKEGYRIVRSYPVITTTDYDSGFPFWAMFVSMLKNHSLAILHPRSWTGLIWWRRDNALMPDTWSENHNDNPDGSEAGP